MTDKTVKTTFRELLRIKELQDPIVIFGSRRGPSENAPFHVRRLIASEDLGPELARRVLVHLQGLAEHAGPEDLAEYEASHAADVDEPRFVRIDSDPVIAEIHASITQNTANIDPFRKEERGNGRLSYYTLVGLDSKGREVRFYNRMAPGRQLKPSPRRLQAFARGDKFIAATEMPLVFDPNFICVSYEGYLFIFGSSGFETLFHYFDDLKAHAAQTLEEINTDNVAIKDFAVLKDAVLGNKANIKRMRGIVKRGHLKKYTVASMNATIKKFKLGVTVRKGADGKPILNWSEGQEKEVLRLLDDYYVVSETSQMGYGTHNKQLLKDE